MRSISKLNKMAQKLALGESRDQIEQDVELFINGEIPVPAYAHQSHPFWKLLGERWIPAVEDALGPLYRQWGMRRGWEGGIGNINFVCDKNKMKRWAVEEAEEALAKEGFRKAPRQPRHSDSSMWVKKHQRVRGGQPMNVYVRIQESFGYPLASASIGVGASEPD